jgi:hypothetical protein
MKPTAMREIFKKLALSLQAAQAEAPPQHARMLTGSLLVRGNIVLQGSLADDYTDALNAMAPRVGEVSPLSVESIDNAIATTLAEFLQTDHSDKELALKQACQTFADKISQPLTSYTIRLGVFGFGLSCEGVEFGRMKLVKKTYTPGRDISGCFFAGMPTEVLLAEVQVSAADFTSARRIAERLVDQHLSILNAICSDRAPSYVSLSRSFLGLELVSLTDFSDQTGKPDQILASTSKAFIPLDRGDFDRNVAARGGTRVSTLLQTRNTFSDRIVAALEIAGAACIEPKEHESLLLFAVALESAVLGRDTQSELTMQLAVRTAHLLSPSLKNRKQVAKAIKRLYGLRSKIVHTGSFLVSKDDVAEMRIHCLTALVVLTTARDFAGFSEAPELDGWFEDQLLGAPTSEVENEGTLEMNAGTPE